jgi:hypothetical protein
MEEVIGLRGTPGHGSLAEWGVSYRQLDLSPEGGIDWEALATAIKPGGCAGLQLYCLCSQGCGGHQKQVDVCHHMHCFGSMHGT